MIIQITASGALELLERDNFKAFKIVAPATHASAQALAAALAPIARLNDDGKTAWVLQDALRQWQGSPQSAQWITAFDQMIESVKRFGWVDEASGSVRGHIEIV